MRNGGEKEIIIYQTNDGKQPFTEWLDGLDKRFVAKVSKRLLRVLLGNLGDYKMLGNGLCELRFADGIRIYFSSLDNVLILLLTGGNKNTKGTQSQDIEKARKYLADYQRRSI
jgi:putative addiction module killer protein